MNLTFLENPSELRSKFFNRFVLTWDEFQHQHADWISKLADKGYDIDLEWYEDAYMWDRMSPAFPRVSFREALAFLRMQRSPVIFLSEAPGHHSRPRLSWEKVHHTDFAATCDAAQLADLIEAEWFEVYRLMEQNMYNPDPVLPTEVYVFDSDMTWFAAFTHETTDWGSELTDPMKAAESRLCVLLRPAEQTS